MEAPRISHHLHPTPGNGHDPSPPPPVAPFVRKLRVPVRVSQPQSSPRDGWLLLSPRLGDGARPETLLELLNSRRAVIPFLAAEDTEVVLLSRRNIGWVAVSGDAPAELIAPEGHPPNHEQRVELRFLDESRVEALIRWSSADGMTRLSDHLNANPGFIAVVTGFGTLIVNSRRIRETRLLGAPSPAAGS